MINQSVKNLQDAIISDINEAKLPPVVAGLVLDRVRARVSEVERSELEREIKEAKEEEYRKLTSAEAPDTEESEE